MGTFSGHGGWQGRWRTHRAHLWINLT
jgi:hypothetical protein